MMVGSTVKHQRHQKNLEIKKRFSIIINSRTQY